jgi:hypothetical protein
MRISSIHRHQSRRRQLLVGLAGVAVSVPNWCSASHFNVIDMVELSAKLTRKSPQQFPEVAAQKLLDAYAQRGLVDRLKALLANPAVDTELAREIVATWYSGVMMTRHGPEVMTYDSALLWGVATFLHPLGYCGGPINYWSLPPTS